MSAATQDARVSGTAGTAAVLDVRDLRVELMTARGVVRAVDGVSLRIGRGETVTIIGESGSGKSTTAMALLDLLPRGLARVSGSALLLGEDLIADPAVVARARGRQVALVPQDPMTALSPVHSIGRQLRGAVRHARPGTSRADAQRRAAELLRQVRLPDPEAVLRKHPHQLSGGMLQRVLIATALAGDPALLVADEPTSALDVTVQAGILDLLLELQERTGVALLLITHDLGVARVVSDRILVLKDGVVVEQGEVERVVDAPAAEYTRRLLAAVPRLGPWDGDVPPATDAATDAASTTGGTP